MLKQRDIENFRNFLDSGTKNANIVKVMLIAIALGTLPFIAVGAAGIGNAVQIFKSKKYNHKQIGDGLRYLKNKRLVEYVNDKGGAVTLRITKKGESKLKIFSMEVLSVKKPKVWDNKWHLVMFDLPVKYKKIRDSLRLKLKQIGFIQFQKSVWVFPYPCTDEILFIADFYKIQKHIEVLTINEIPNDKKLRLQFKLEN